MKFEEYRTVFKTYQPPAAKKEWEADSLRIRRHTRGEDIASLIGTRRPNEDQATLEYRIKNMMVITRDPFKKAIDNIERTVSHSMVEVIYPEKVRDYCNEPHFAGLPLLAYIQKRVRPMIEAANGLLIMWPININDGSKPVDITPITVMPSDIVHFDEEILNFLSREKSPVKFDGDIHYIGKVYYIIAEDELWKRVQINDAEGEDYEWQPYATNSTGTVFSMVLGGDATSKTDERGNEIHYLTSYLSTATEFADECLNELSDCVGVRVNCAFPFREISPIKCVAHGCKNGWIDVPGGSGTIKCGNCDNSGYQNNITSAYGYIRRPVPSNLDPASQSEVPVLRYITPDVAILENCTKSWQDFFQRTKDALNLLRTEEAQSGVAKDIDREDNLAAVDKIAVNIYLNLLSHSVWVIHRFLYPSIEDVPPTQINLPTTFIIKSEEEITSEIGALRTQGASPIIIGEKNRQLMTKSFGGDPVRMKIYNAVSALDPLSAKTPKEVADLFAANAISQQDFQYNLWAYPMTQLLSLENESFDTLTVNEVIAAVIPMIKEKIALLPKAVPSE